MKISRFKVKNLFGTTDVDIPITDNKLLLVGQNGTGKTTLVNIFYYFLSQQWHKLSDFDFESITIKISNRNLTIQKSELPMKRIPNRQLWTTVHLESYKEQMSELPVQILREIVEDETRSTKSAIWKHMDVQRKSLPLHNSLVQHARRILNEIGDVRENNLEGIVEFLTEKINSQIIYLPTYRRIEKELTSLFPDAEERVREFSHRSKQQRAHEYVELVEFGMEDISDLIKAKRGKTLETATAEFETLAGQFLHDVLNETADQFNASAIVSLSDSYIDSVLDRVQETTLAHNDKEKIRDFVKKIRTSGTASTEAEARIGYLFGKILEAAEKIERQEFELLTLVQICNKYFFQKKLVYDRTKYDLSIANDNGDRVALKNLSSGEKQILSLFCHLTLNDWSNFILIIDEPELSLSVHWQEQLLPDILGLNKCDFLCAVTHSPFIFNNELDAYAANLTEFMSSK